MKQPKTNTARLELILSRIPVKDLKTLTEAKKIIREAVTAVRAWRSMEEGENNHEI